MFTHHRPASRPSLLSILIGMICLGKPLHAAAASVGPGGAVEEKVSSALRAWTPQRMPLSPADALPITSLSIPQPTPETTDPAHCKELFAEYIQNEEAYSKNLEAVLLSALPGLPRDLVHIVSDYCAPSRLRAVQSWAFRWPVYNAYGPTDHMRCVLLKDENNFVLVHDWRSSARSFHSYYTPYSMQAVPPDLPHERPTTPILLSQLFSATITSRLRGIEPGSFALSDIGTLPLSYPSLPGEALLTADWSFEGVEPPPHGHPSQPQEQPKPGDFLFSEEYGGLPRSGRAYSLKVQQSGGTPPLFSIILKSATPFRRKTDPDDKAFEQSCIIGLDGTRIQHKHQARSRAYDPGRGRAELIPHYRLCGGGHGAEVTAGEITERITTHHITLDRCTTAAVHPERYDQSFGTGLWSTTQNAIMSGRPNLHGILVLTPYQAPLVLPHLSTCARNGQSFTMQQLCVSDDQQYRACIMMDNASLNPHGIFVLYKFAPWSSLKRAIPLSLASPPLAPPAPPSGHADEDTADHGRGTCRAVMKRALTILAERAIAGMRQCTPGRF